MKKTVLLGLTALILFTLLIGACNSGMSDDEKEIAIAVALTQTAAAVPPSATAPAPAAVALTATVEPAAVAPTSTAVITSDMAALPMPATAVTVTPAIAAGATPTAALQAAAQPGSMDPLPVTQPAAKVRTLLVAPGEPGPLYALLTDEIADNAPVTNPRFLVSRNFGESWESAPSGLPELPADCLYNVSMDYYGPTALFASTCQGLYRWSQAEPSWSLLTAEPTGMVAVVYSNPDLIWATRPFVPGEPPLLRSQDGGATWATVALSHTNGIANIGINPRDTQTGYAIVWPDEDPGSDLRRGAFFLDWLVMPGPNGNQALNIGMTIDGGTGNLYVSTNEPTGARLWRSTNPDTPNLADVQWGQVYQASPGVNLEVLSSGWSSQEDELSIYANFTKVVDNQLTYALYRSLDSGRTWSPVTIAQ